MRLEAPSAIREMLPSKLGRNTKVKGVHKLLLIVMIPVVLIVGAGILGVAFYAYSQYLEMSTHRGSADRVPYRGRDMWKASLLDCDYEPAKYVFGPGKAIPADSGLTRVSSDTPFYVHKQHS